jgi:hypothetical protein
MYLGIFHGRNHGSSSSSLFAPLCITGQTEKQEVFLRELELDEFFVIIAVEYMDVVFLNELADIAG